QGPGPSPLSRDVEHDAAADDEERATHPPKEMSDGGAEQPSEPADSGPPPDPHENEPFRQPLPNPLVRSTDPAYRYANLSPWQCRKELAKRKLPLERQRETKGIAT